MCPFITQMVQAGEYKQTNTQTGKQTDVTKHIISPASRSITNITTFMNCHFFICILQNMKCSRHEKFANLGQGQFACIKILQIFGLQISRAFQWQFRIENRSIFSKITPNFCHYIGLLVLVRKLLIYRIFMKTSRISRFCKICEHFMFYSIALFFFGSHLLHWCDIHLTTKHDCKTYIYPVKSNWEKNDSDVTISCT